MMRFALLLASLLVASMTIATTPALYSPCDPLPAWNYLNCASRRDEGRGRYLELLEELKLLSSSGERETLVSIRNWLDTYCDRYPPDIADELIRTFLTFKSASLPGGGLDHLLGRQSFRRLPMSKRLDHYSKALRDGGVYLDSGYVLRTADAVHDVGALGLSELEPLIRDTKRTLPLRCEIALWKMRFRAGAGSQAQAAQLHLSGIEQLPFEFVADAFLNDQAFSISVAHLRDDLCDPVRSPQCDEFKGLLAQWLAQTEADPELSSTHPNIEVYANLTLTTFLKKVIDAVPSMDHCCRPQ